MSPETVRIIAAARASVAYSFDAELRAGKSFAEALQGFTKHQRQLRRAVRAFDERQEARAA